MNKAVIVIIVLLAVGLIVLLLTPMFHQWNADRVNDIKQAYLIQDANKRIAYYEWFYSQYAEVQATRNKVKILEGQPEQKSVQLVLESMIAEYNAKSKMTMTRELWKASDLPYQIE